MKYQTKTKEEILRRILRECIKRKEFVGSEIVNALGLTKPTVNDAIEILMNNGFLKKQSLEDGKVGRRAQIWSTDLSNKIALAMEIDFGLIKIAVVDMSGEIHFYKEYINIKLDNNNCLDVLFDILTEYKSNLSMKYRKNIKHLGIAIPGNVTTNRKGIVYATNLGLQNINFLSLEKKIKLEITLENEANSAALGEFFLSNDNDNTTSLFISISNYGVGGGHIVDGKLQKGAHRRGGEIGHFTLVMYGKICSCGNAGCFERYASNEALIELMNTKNLECGSIEELFENDDSINTEIIKEYSAFLGRGIRSLLAIFDAHKIIISGKLTKYWDKVFPYIHHNVFYENHFYPNPLDIIIKPAISNQDAALVGVGLINFFPHVYESSVYK